MLLLAIVVQPSAHLCATRYSRRTNEFLKVTVPWPTYIHCLHDFSQGRSQDFSKGGG